MSLWSEATEKNGTQKGRRYLPGGRVRPGRGGGGGSAPAPVAVAVFDAMEARKFQLAIRGFAAAVGPNSTLNVR